MGGLRLYNRDLAAFAVRASWDDLSPGVKDALKITLDFKAIGAPGSAKLRDLWGRKDLGTVQKSYAAEVPKHGVVLLKVSK